MQVKLAEFTLTPLRLPSIYAAANPSLPGGGGAIPDKRGD